MYVLLKTTHQCPLPALALSFFSKSIQTNKHVYKTAALKNVSGCWGIIPVYWAERSIRVCSTTHGHRLLSGCPAMSGSQELRQDSHLQARQAQPETQNRRQWCRQRVSLFSSHEMHDFPMLWFLGISIAFPGKLIKSMRTLLETEASEPEVAWPLGENSVWGCVWIHFYSYSVIWFS